MSPYLRCWLASRLLCSRRDRDQSVPLVQHVERMVKLNPQPGDLPVGEWLRLGTLAGYGPGSRLVALPASAQCPFVLASAAEDAEPRRHASDWHRPSVHLAPAVKSKQTPWSDCTLCCNDPSCKKERQRHPQKLKIPTWVTQQIRREPDSALVVELEVKDVDNM